MSYCVATFRSGSAICGGRKEKFNKVYEKKTYNGVLEVSFAPLVDVKDPLVVRFDSVRRQADDLDIALLKIGGTARDLREFGGAYRSEVIRVRKKDGLASTSVSVIIPGNKISKHTQELPIHSWNLMVPLVVSASKSGAILPRRRVGILFSSDQGREGQIGDSHMARSLYKKSRNRDRIEKLSLRLSHAMSIQMTPLHMIRS